MKITSKIAMASAFMLLAACGRNDNDNYANDANMVDMNATTDMNAGMTDMNATTDMNAGMTDMNATGANDMNMMDMNAGNTSNTTNSM